MSELDALDPPENEPIKLSDGTQILIEHLRARQFFKLVRIITRGAVPNMRDFGLFNLQGVDREEFAIRFMSVMLMSIPEAEDETIEFVRSMVRPAGLITRRSLNKQDAERNTALWAAVDAALDNPELDDLVTIIEAIIHREADDIQALGKRLSNMLNLAIKTGQVAPPQPPTSPEPTSSADSPEPTISWPNSTDGQTNTSAGFGSVEFVNVSPSSPNDATTPPGTENND